MRQLLYPTLIFAICLLLKASQAFAIQVVSKGAGINIDSEKVAHIGGDIGYLSSVGFEIEMNATSHLPGDRIIIINSTGGYVYIGEQILEAIDAERAATGERVVCGVDKTAMSMAFNILTRCDVRLAVANATFMFHPIYMKSVTCRGGCKPKTLRKIAKDLEKSDEPYRHANSKALGLAPTDYDVFADNDTIWRADKLLRMGYLHGIVEVLK